MKTNLMSKNDLRKRRHARVRARVRGTAERPRLTVFKSNRFVSAQLINDDAGKTLASASGQEKGGAQSEQAKHVGIAIAKAAKAAGVTEVVFDRAGYQYTGLVKTLADTAREHGLSF